MIQPFLQQKLSVLIPLFKQYNVSTAYAFGSVTTDKFNSKSDIDLLVDFDETMEPAERGEMIWQMWDDLEKIFKRRVDLVTEKSLTNPYFIEELNEKKMLLYGKA